MDRVDEYTIYIVEKGLVTESVIRTPLQMNCITQICFKVLAIVEILNKN